MTESDHLKWELGGLVDANGRLGRALPSGRLLIPAKAELRDGFLEWEGCARTTTPSVAMLEQFVLLADGPDERVLRFAKRWGPMFDTLAQCDWNAAAHDWSMPDGYKRTHYHDPDLADPCACRWYLFEQPIDGGRESLRIWRKYARRARGFLRIAAALNGQNVDSPTGDRYDWQCALEVEEHPDSTIDDMGYDWRDRDDARFLLSQRLDWWLYLAGCRPTVALGSSQPISLQGDGLFGVIALQLSFIASVSRGLALCAACGTAFSPHRLVKPGARHIAGLVARRQRDGKLHAATANVDVRLVGQPSVGRVGSGRLRQSPHRLARRRPASAWPKSGARPDT